MKPMNSENKDKFDISWYYDYMTLECCMQISNVIIKVYKEYFKDKIIRDIYHCPNDWEENYERIHPSIFSIDVTYEKMITGEDILKALNDCAGKWIK